MHSGYYESNFFGGLPRVGFGFSLGILLQQLTRDVVPEQHIRALVRRLPYPSFLLYAAVLAIFLFPKTAHGFYPLLALVTIVPGVVFVSAHVNLTTGLQQNVAKFLGWISYPIYCLHYPFVRLAILMRDSGYGSGYLLLAAGTAASFVLAIVLTRWCDEPVRSWLSGGRKRTPSSLQSQSLVRAPRPN
jgi:peptidoglycan/LPS O-acetylase OafA/YrhL